MKWCEPKEVQVELQEYRRAIDIQNACSLYLLWRPKASRDVLKCQSSHFPLTVERVRAERVYREMNIMIEVPNFSDQPANLLLRGGLLKYEFGYPLQAKGCSWREPVLSDFLSLRTLRNINFPVLKTKQHELGTADGCKKCYGRKNSCVPLNRHGS